MLLIITFAVVLTMALSVQRAGAEARDALCDCRICDLDSAVIIPFPTATALATPASASVSA
jgi:hypothetical protein